MTKKVIAFRDNSTHTVHYENSDDNTVVKFSAGDRTVTSHSKTDSFGRKEFDELRLSTGFISRRFIYHTGETTKEHESEKMLHSTPTTQLVSQIIFSGGRTISYEYDVEERITKVTDSSYGVTEYNYDALGQLLTEIADGIVINEMTYDNYGNIISKNGIEYSYDDVWKDQLNKVGDKEIIYDAQGNPTSYLGHNLTWEKGRQLKSFDNVSFTYNANGIRTSKTVNGVKHTYVLDGTKIIREECTYGDEGVYKDTYIPLYDNEDSICGIKINNDYYYFIKNLQGDVIAITDNDGETVAEYVYDAWGKVISITGSNIEIANINPFRYRTYYFDREIGLYYLQSRYYDATVGRFVNPDTPEYILISARITINGLYTYCINDPISNKDEYGYASINSLKRESWIARAVLKYIPSLSYSIMEKEIFSTPKWLGVYLSLTVGISTQRNPNGIIGLGFSPNSFDIGLALNSGKISTAVAVGASWTESYIAASLVYSSKIERIFYSVNFKLAIKHWLTLTAAVVCCIVPQLVPIAAYIVKILGAAASTAKPILIAALPLLLGVK